MLSTRTLQGIKRRLRWEMLTTRLQANGFHAGMVEGEALQHDN